MTGYQSCHAFHEDEDSIWPCHGNDMGSVFPYGPCHGFHTAHISIRSIFPYGPYFHAVHISIRPIFPYVPYFHTVHGMDFHMGILVLVKRVHAVAYEVPPSYVSLWNVFSQTTTVGLKPVALPERANMALHTTMWGAFLAYYDGRAYDAEE